MAIHSTRSRGSIDPISDTIRGDANGHVKNSAYEYRDELNAVIWDSGIKSLGRCSLRGCTSIKFLEFPPSLRSIGEYAICNCSDLNSILFNEGLEKLEDHALQGCGSLMDVTIPQSVNDVGDCAFKLCLKLEEARILGSPKFGKNVFADCVNLKRILSKARDSSRIEHAIPDYMRRVEAEGEWPLVYERIKDPESPVVVTVEDDEKQESCEKGVKSNAKSRPHSLHTTARQRSAPRSNTDEEQGLPKSMAESKARLEKEIDVHFSHCLLMDKENKKGLRKVQTKLTEMRTERDNLKAKVDRLEAKLLKQKKRGVGDEGLQESMEQQKKHLADLQRNIEDLRAHINLLREQVKALEKDKKGVESQLENEKALNRTMKDEKQDMEAKLEEVTKERDALRNQVSDLNAMESRNPLETPRRRNHGLQDSGTEESTVESLRQNKRRREGVLQGCMDSAAKRLRGESSADG